MTVVESARQAFAPRLKDLCFLPSPPRQNIRHIPLAGGGAAFPSFSALRKTLKPAPRGGEIGNAALECLAGGPLAGRFRAWRGGSGRRYVCSVFRIDPAAPDRGLPEFAGVVVLAIERLGGGGRRPIGIYQGQSGAGARAFIGAAVAAGADEWHVHLPAGAAEERRAVVADLEAGRTRR
jgi:hypothetical protein